jgi:hypothetical protein
MAMLQLHQPQKEVNAPLTIVLSLFYGSFMDWVRAIEINRAALARIVGALVSLLAAQGGAARVPLPVYQLIARVLYPAESAVRRLIVIAARGLEVSVPPARPMPKGLVIAGQGLGRVSFQLFDTRKTFGDLDDVDDTRTGPRIRSIGEADPRSQFLAQFAVPDRGELSSEAETLRVRRRLDALKQALDHLPRQAKRMARWMKRRAAMAQPKFRSPLRPGRPPGHRKRGRDEIDLVLVECHALAWDALRANTS